MKKSNKCNCGSEPFEQCQCFVAYPKPGKTQKKVKKTTRSKIREIEKPTDTYCRFCGKPDDGTAYYHHCEDPYLKHRYGKGIGTKIDDRLTVWSHHRCGEAMSKKPLDHEDSPEFEQWRMLWYLAIIETWLV